MSFSKRLGMVLLLAFGVQLVTQDAIGSISEAAALACNVVGCVLLAFWVNLIVDYIDKAERES